MGGTGDIAYSLSLASSYLKKICILVFQKAIYVSHVAVTKGLANEYNNIKMATYSSIFAIWS